MAILIQVNKYHGGSIESDVDAGAIRERDRAIFGTEQWTEAAEQGAARYPWMTPRAIDPRAENERRRRAADYSSSSGSRNGRLASGILPK